MNDDLRTLWTETEEEEMRIDFDALRVDAAEFRKAIRRRNGLEVGAAAVVALWFGVVALQATSLLIQLSASSLVLGAFYISYILLTRGQHEPIDASASTAVFLDARREELHHQAALLEAVPRWYLAPMLPGLAGFTLAPALVGDLGHAATMAVISLAVLGGAWWLNAHAARGLRAQAAALPRVAGT